MVMPNGPEISRLPSDADRRPRNQLLRRLTAAEFARVQPHLKTVPVKVKHVFYRLDEPLSHVVFPNGGVASLTTVMQDGNMVESATVGNEGLLGAEVFLGAERAAGEAMMQVGDATVELMPVAAFQAEVALRGSLFEAVQRYSHALLMLTMQSAACSALHGVQERCCRWLLMTHDRIGEDVFYLSHEFLAMMLGATRPTVTVVAGTLQEAGLISYKHGRVQIRDRSRLEAASCECYAAVKPHFDRLRVYDRAGNGRRVPLARADL